MKIKEKTLVEKKSESKWKEDVDTAIEEVISRFARTEEARSSQIDLIANIITEEPAAVTSIQVATKQTPTKSLVTAPRVSNKLKEA